ncbi:MAG: hypothetical protein ABI318_13900 [Chthoniobacteraceae bacterium]
MKQLISLALVLTLCGCGPKNEVSTSDAPKNSTGSHDAGGPITEAKLGVKIYPGARIVTSGETEEVVSANLETSDAPEKVIKFYEQELGAAKDSSGMVMAKKNGRTFVVNAVPSGAGSAVSIMGKK